MVINHQPTRRSTLLVLTRKTDEVITIQNPDDPTRPIEITVVEIKGNAEVRLGITAPRSTVVDRREVWELKQAEKLP